jgi:hypothetical protein
VGALNEDSAATGINGNQADESATNSGAVYLFTRSGVTWSQKAYVKASNTGSGDSFGSSVALTSDMLAIGAFAEESNVATLDSGAVYVYRTP